MEYYDFVYIYLIPSLFCGFVLFITLFIVMKYNRKRKNVKEKFFNSLTNNFEQQLISDKDDITFLLNSVSREFDSIYSLADILEDYITYVSKNEDSNNKIKKEVYDLIKSIISTEKQEKPFSNVPNEEKRILTNINEYIKINNMEQIKSNLQELGAVMATRNRHYEKINKINKFAIIIAVIGITLTIVFGIIGTNKIDYKKLKKLLQD
jgi:hypothetical protein